MKRLLAKTVLAAAIVVLMSAYAPVHAAPIVYSGSLTPGVTAFDDVPYNSISDSTMWDYWSIFGTVGDVVTIVLDRTSGQMDPAVSAMVRHWRRHDRVRRVPVH